MAINVLHVALEGGPAVFGGLGRVATQMLAVQNQFKLGNEQQVNASIITPLYPSLYKDIHAKQLIAEVPHLFDHKIIISKVYLTYINGNPYYLCEPPAEYQHLFALDSKVEIYGDTEHSLFITRVKFLCSLVAAYVNDPNLGSHHPTPQILHLHDWQAALVPEILKKVYKNTTIKNVFIVHIDSGDRGTYTCESLQGIGLEFAKNVCILKAIGLLAADKIVAVSTQFLHECITAKSNDPEMEFLRKIFAFSSVQGKTIGIANGINYHELCPIGKKIKDPENIYSEKCRLKRELAAALCGVRLTWKFDPNLPLILYVGRYSPEKGPEVFEQIIQDVKGRATFIAVGRGMTDDVFRVLIKHSRQTDNVFVTASEKEQAQLLEIIRAAADIAIIPSHRDAFGLVAPEGLANGCILITTGAGGLKGIVKPLNFTDKNNISGNGVIYEDAPQGGYNPDLRLALDAVLGLLEELTPTQRNTLQKRIIKEAQSFDWAAPDGSLEQYLGVYQDLLAKKPEHTRISAYKLPSLF